MATPSLTAVDADTPVLLEEGTPDLGQSRGSLLRVLRVVSGDGTRVDGSEIDISWRIPGNVSLHEEEAADECTAAIRELSQSAQELLKNASFLGSLDSRLLEAATNSSATNISKQLKTAAEKKVIMYTDESREEYAFTSQDVRDTVYRGVPDQDRCRVHVAIGRSLVRNFTQGELKDNFYPVLRQFRLGMDGIKNQTERNAIAALCLRAGELAVSNGDCRAASQYLEFGIELLGSNCWEEEYDLTLALYNASAEVEYGTANFERVHWLVSTVLDRAISFRDTLRARAARIYSLTSTYHMTEAVAEGLDVLNRLGETFPAEPKKYHVIVEAVRTRQLLRKKTNERILRMSPMTDPDKTAAMQILNLLVPCSYRTSPFLHALIIFRLIRLTMLHGLSSVSAVGFAFFGSMLCAFLSTFSNHIDEGYRYGQLALALLDHFHAREWIPRVYLGVYGHTNSYKHHLQELYSPLQQAYRTGLETGDIQFATLNASTYCAFMLLSGDSLVRLEQEAMSVYEIELLHKQETTLLIMRCGLQFGQNLMGKNDNALKLQGDIVKDEASMLSRVVEANDEMGLGFLHFYLVVLAYIFNDYAAASAYATGINEMVRRPYLHPSTFCVVAFHSLALVAIVNERHGLARRNILAIVRRGAKQLKKLSLHTPENCLAKTYLLEAELAAVTGNNRLAKCKYVSAIGVAAEFGDLMIRAVACERTAHFFRGCGDKSAADRYFRQAHSAYMAWGATAKVESLEKEMPELLL